MKSKKEKIFLLIIFFIFLLTSFFLRFWKLSDWLYFMIDEERDAFMVKRIVADHRPVLIGGKIPGGVYLGPGFYYLSSIIMFFSKLNPIGGGIVASLLGVVSTLVLFFIAKKLFGQKTAIVASVFYNFSYLVIIYNRIWWPLVLSPLITLGVYFCLFKIIKEKKLNYIYLLSLLLILGAQSDPSTFSLIVLVIVFWIIFKLPLKNKIIRRSVLIFFLAHAPLVIFDLRHDFLNLKGLIKLLSFSASGDKISLFNAFEGLYILPKVLARLLFISGPNDLIKQISPCPYYLDLKDRISLLLLIFSLLITVYFLYKFLRKRKHDFGILLIGSHLLIILMGVFVYNLFFPGYTYEWFYYLFFPSFCLMTASFIIFCYKKKWLRPIIILFFLFFLTNNLQNFITAKNSFGFTNKTKAVQYTIRKLGNEDFFLDSLGSCFGYGGYRYLFYLYGKEPTTSYMDYIYADWLYPRPVKEKPKLGVIIVSPADKEEKEFEAAYDSYKAIATESKKFGQIEVLIVNEEN